VYEFGVAFTLRYGVVPDPKDPELGLEGGDALAAPMIRNGLRLESKVTSPELLKVCIP
jgi:hypothetical protein